MLYLSKNIPTDIWLTNVDLAEDKITIEGESESYKSIGLFIENLKSSIFFNETLNLVESKTVENPVLKRRTEYFKITSEIARYD